jgi:hypothetical protein
MKRATWTIWWGVTILLLLCDLGVAQNAVPTGPYEYAGGSFLVTVTFKAYSSFEFDGSGGGDVGNPGWVVVSNLNTGNSQSFTYLQSLQLPGVPDGDTSAGQSLSGTVTIDADALGPGPLTFQVQGVDVSRPFHPSRSVNNVYGEYVNTMLVPTNVQVSLPPFQSNSVSGSPPGQPVRSGGLVSNTSSKIHAVIISGLPDPAKVIVSPNVTLTGGIIALGKNASPPLNPSGWTPGLRIVPDYGLLTGEKIPPVTPNILDVRIVRQEVTADFPSTSPTPND